MQKRVFSVIFFCLAIVAIAAENPRKKVLILHSYQIDQTWADNVLRGLQRGFSVADSSLDLFYEFMDSRRFNGAAYNRLLNDFYRSKYRGVQFDILLAADDYALDFITAHSTLFKGEPPVVYCGINNYRRQLDDFKERYCGVIEAFNVQKTLELALSLHPGTKKIYVIDDKSRTGETSLLRFKEQVKPYADSLEFVYWVNEQKDKILKDVSNLPDSSLVFLLLYGLSPQKEVYDLQETAKAIAQFSNKPVYSFWDIYLGQGIVGGYLLSGEMQGAIAAKIALEILFAGKSPGDFPPKTDITYQYMFDARMLVKYGIKESSLPAGSLVINRTITFFNRYKRVIVFTTVIIFLQLAVILLLLFNIQLRKKTQKQLLLNKAYLKNVYDFMPSLMIILDEDGRIVNCNAQVENYTGINEDVAKGHYLSFLFPQPEFKEYLSKIEAAIKAKIIYKKQKLQVDIIGQSVLIDIMVYPLISEIGKGVAIRIDNVTTRVKMEEMMVQTEKMLSIGGLAGGIAHEINNPLGGIIQGAQTVVRRLDPHLEMNKEVAEQSGLNLDNLQIYLEKREIEKFLQGIRDSGERAANIISNMLTFAQQEKKGYAYHRMEDLISQSLELAAADIQLKRLLPLYKVDIRKEYEPKLPHILCNSTEMEQVFLNLIKNSLQAIAKSGQIHPQLIFRLRKMTKFLRIEIEDNGQGMNDEVRKRIFEPFFTTKNNGQGTGLGLAVSYFIITNNHKGKIHVVSAEGKGTKFVIHLPKDNLKIE